MKKILFCLLLLVHFGNKTQAMELRDLSRELAGIGLLTGGFYCAIEGLAGHLETALARDEDPAQRHIARACANSWLKCAVMAGGTGYVLLTPSIARSATPVKTSVKLVVGSTFLAAAAHGFKFAGQYHRQYQWNHHYINERERNQFLAGAMVCGTLGMVFVGAGMHDIKRVSVA